MDEWILISIGIIVLLVLIGVVLSLVLFKKRKKGELGEPNYQTFFSIGVIWFPVGVVFMFTVNTSLGVTFMGLGIIYLVIGLVNRDKWMKKK